MSDPIKFSGVSSPAELNLKQWRGELAHSAERPLKGPFLQWSAAARVWSAQILHIETGGL